ncbi:MAG: 4-(cytidine 5'-diphospho)-2-C-methyl-D-erythritol kinase [Bacteroidales bacterium]|nr:4-(cytidine 5'-diphospho)-2-C-methyl-D-erythritol kinase [Bacteroidales bacterium]MCF8344010.1 4-(cytidine 5'-diphospho)-2-C-methyl-D-erythritol kinase [Bacteroidales bacterium]MCF8349722.1 4-(cytidine 5'-diphospho)-2-C-methyl-D-erythritol kinase [Bacteroidales bacterium]MCF8376677.1 4-(cytidine 5'-diphospho)-2-C-methyl-D-erythritol kinase [Bacteroidales bacterium]MCF8401760.1 4-(cytidine 5'-diphospho)-2-C-methyl-D-erythritol kinase [Bacteroidales bacterium]
MIVFPNSKINIGLHILRKRTDGFHEIESLFYPVSLKDALEIIPAKDGSFDFRASGLPIPGNPSENICVKAYELVRAKYGIPPVKMHLHKAVPMQAGLGGGSADGAFSLKLLDTLFELKLGNAKLKELALQLGSDCPFFIENRPAIAGGRGELLKTLDFDLSGYHLVLIKPDLNISTAEAYAMARPDHNRPSLEKLVKTPVASWKDHVQNDFEKSLFSKYPELAHIKKKLYANGAIYASMSGSGSTVYGLFEEQTNIENQFGDCLFKMLRL